jgi:hypothetical protein
MQETEKTRDPVVCQEFFFARQKPFFFVPGKNCLFCTGKKLPFLPNE